MKSEKKTIFLIILILIRFAWIFFTNREIYLTAYDTDYRLKEYESSQWKLGEKARKFLSDAETHAIVGYQYIKGADPSTTNPEHPPLGRDLIGASIMIFKNEKMGSFLLGILILSLYFFLARIYLSSTSALLAVGLLSLEPLFVEQMLISMLDLPHLLFILAFLICFLKGEKKNSFLLFALSSFFLGLAMGTKIYLSSLIFMGFTLLWLFVKGDFHKFMLFYFSLIFLPVSYLLSYLQYFIHHPSIIQFAKFQRWLTSWWAGTPIVQKGIVWPMLLLGKWYTWWGKEEIMRVNTYTLLWPIVTLLALGGTGLAFKRKYFDILFISLFVFGYLSFLSFEPVFSRHLLVVFPGLYILALYFLEALSKKLAKKQETG